MLMMLCAVEYRKRMAKELSTLFSDEDAHTDLSHTLKQLDDTIQASAFGADSADTLFLGPFGLFSSCPLERLSSSSSTQTSDTTTCEIVSAATTDPESPTILGPEVSINLELCLDVQDHLLPDSPAEVAVPSDTHSLGQISPHGIPASSDGAATIGTLH